MSEKTELQEDIIHEASIHTDWSDEKIATEVDCSASYVNQVRNDYANEIDQKNSENTVVGLLILLLIGFAAAHEMGLL